jgi:hypothetical protein
MTAIQGQIEDIWSQQEANQFGTERYAYLFKPGSYSLNVKLSYYTTAHGLGFSPDDVTITGGVQSLGVGTDRSALNNFWRGAENLAVMPPVANNINKWAVSQATFLRRFHLKDSGQLFLFDFATGPAGTSSGGFVADSKVDQLISSGSQQQFMSRNNTMTTWNGGLWNMVFVGDEIGALTPAGSWPSKAYTVVDKTPVIREKPYLVMDSNGNYTMQVPQLKKDSQGTGWAGTTSDAATTLPINQFYIAKSTTDTAESLNTALQQGYHLILTPGVYHLDCSLNVVYADTVVLGLGMATLTPDRGTPALTIADVDGVSISGILFDAGPQQSSSLLLAGLSISNVDHSANPTVLYDLSCRVGGATASASAQNCFTINVNNLILDNVWLWRADHGKDPHGNDVGWNINPADNGLTVNGQCVTAYGLFVEHFKGFQTLWNGNDGSVYFYQSEIPYDVPSQGEWQQKNVNEKGYPSYKVSCEVTRHTAQGLGVYSNFLTKDIQLDNAIETPVTPGIQMQHMVTIWLNGAKGTSINHVINGTGDAVYDKGLNTPTEAQV